MRVTETEYQYELQQNRTIPHHIQTKPLPLSQLGLQIPLCWVGLAKTTNYQAHNLKFA